MRINVDYQYDIIFLIPFPGGGGAAHLGGGTVTELENVPVPVSVGQPVIRPVAEIPLWYLVGEDSW